MKTKTKTMVLQLSALASAMALLAACGGGGGGGGEEAVAPPVATGGAIGGVAAKGILKNAKVTAYCGNSEATADLLVTGVTGTAGEYSLKWTTDCTKPLKLVVELGTGTTMADEATGKDVTPPAGFKLRALVADPSTTATKNITPFTDMAAAIAGTASTKESISNAELAIVNTVLGGDIGAYQAKPVAPTAAAMAAASTEEKKLATLLTVISAFAQDNASCKTKSTDGDRIKCATDTFAAQAAATVTGVSDTGYKVATTVPADTPATMLAATLTRITAGTITGVTATDLSTDVTADTSGASTLLMAAEDKVTTAASSGGTVTVAAGSASGIQAARDLFNSLKTDLAALSNGSGSGFLDKKLGDAKADFSTNGHASVTGLLKFTAAINLAAQMANEAKTWTAPSATGLVANAAYPVAGHGDLVLITDASGAAHQFIRYFATTYVADNQAVSMNCRVNVSEMSQGKAGCFYADPRASAAATTVTTTTTGTVTGYFHGVRVAEGTTSGSYTWQDYFGSRTYSSTQRYATPAGLVFVPGTSFMPSPDGPKPYKVQLNYANFAVPVGDPVNGSALTGTAALTLDASGKVTAETMKGDIQALAEGQDKSTLDISVAMSSDSSTQTADLSGTVTNVQGTTTSLSLALASGSKVVAATGTAGHPVSANLVMQLKTAAFQYDGTLSMATFTADKAGDYKPANASFAGKISTLASGAATEFLSGTLALKLTNLADFDPAAATSSTNFVKGTASFTGKVSNDATAYELTFIADGSVYGQQSATLNYTRAGTQMVNVTASRTDATSTNVLTIKGTGDVNAVLTNGRGDVKVGTSTVGSITDHPSQVNFTDGTYLLLGV